MVSIVDNVDGTYIACDPRDHCRHGVYVGGCGWDFMCPVCEAGDPEPTVRELAVRVDRLARELWGMWDAVWGRLVDRIGEGEAGLVFGDMEEAFGTNRLAGELRRAVEHRDAVAAVADGPDDRGYLVRRHAAAIAEYLAQPDQELIDRYLAGNGYGTVEDWALDSDYERCGDGGWVDRDHQGDPVDIRDQLLNALV